MSGMVLRSGRVLGATPPTPKRRRTRNANNTIAVDANVIDAQIKPEPIIVSAPPREQLDEPRIVLEPDNRFTNDEPDNRFTNDEEGEKQEDVCGNNLTLAAVLALGLIGAVMNFMLFVDL